MSPVAALALLQRLVVLAEPALQSARWHAVRVGIRERMEELDLGTGSGLTSEGGVDRSGTAGVRIRGRALRRLSSLQGDSESSPTEMQPYHASTSAESETPGCV